MKKVIFKWTFSMLCVIAGFGLNAQNLVISHPSTNSINCNGSAEIDMASFNSTSWYWTDNSGNVIQQGGTQVIHLCAGSYTLKYTGANNVSMTSPFVIDFDSQNNCASLTGFVMTKGHNPNESANCNGGATAIPTGGTPPYTYEWYTASSGGSNISTEDTLFNVCADTFYVKLHDANNCVKNLMAIVGIDTTEDNNNGNNGNNCNLNAQIDITPNIGPNGTSAAGTCYGTAKANVVGAIGTPHFEWKDQSGTVISTSHQIANLCTGPYMLHLTDSSSCFKDINVFISDNTNNGGNNGNNCTLNAQIDVTPNIGPNGTNAVGTCYGTAKANVMGVTGTPHFEWKDQSGTVISTSHQIANLCTGPYMLHLTDSSSCFKDFNIFISDSTNTGGNNGNNCNLNAQIDVTPNIGPNGTNAVGTCYGTAKANVMGAIGTPHFEWKDQTGNVISTSHQIANLCTGPYMLHLTDSSSCFKDFNVFISDSTNTGGNNGNNCNLNAQIDVTPNIGPNGTSAAGTCYGTAKANVMGATGTPHFEWKDHTGNVISTSHQIANLCTGNYMLHLTDSSSCYKDFNVFISDNTNSNNNGNCASLSASITTKEHNPQQNSQTCNGGAIAKAMGGVAPYTYEWFDSNTQLLATFDSLKNVCPGVYTVKIHDSQQCERVMSAHIGSDSTNANPNCTLEVNVTNTPNVAPTSGNPPAASCFGSANATVMGNIGMLNFEWKDQSGTVIGTTHEVSNLCTGGYMLHVSDSAGCHKNISIFIPDNNVNNNNCSSFNAQIITKPHNPHQNTPNCNGGAFAKAMGGTSPYSYEWMSASFPAIIATIDTLKNVCAGMYKVKIHDSNNCEKILDAMIGEDTNMMENNCNIHATIQVMPNIAPVNAAGGTSASCYGKLSASVTGSAGMPHFEWKDQAGQVIGTSHEVSNLCTGHYSVRISDSTGCFKMFNEFISDNAPMNPCDSIHVSHMTKPNNPNQNTQGCNGGALVNVSGGTEPYTFEWFANAGGNVLSTTDSLMNVCANNYYVKIKDANNCMRSIQIMILNDTNTMNPNCDIQVIIHAMPNTLQVNCNGKLMAEIQGAQGTPALMWKNSTGTVIGTQPEINNLCAGDYTLKVQDTTGCFQIFGAVIVNDTTPHVDCSTLNASLTNRPHNPSINVNCNGGAYAHPTGGAAPYTFEWYNSTSASSALATTDSLNNVCPGTYYVKIHDANNCVKSMAIMVHEDTTHIDPCTNVQMLVALSSTDNTSATNTCNGTLTAAVTGGATPYIYVWTPNGATVSGATFSGLCAGTYTVMVKDANGCMKTATGVVNTSIIDPCANATIVATLTPSANTVAAPNCNGKIVASVTGGTQPYAYAWAPNTAVGTGTVVENLCAGNYYLTVTDSNGCTKTATTTIVNNIPVDPCLNTQITATVTVVNNTSTNSSCNGSVVVAANGGTAPYTYAWTPNSNAATGPYMTNLCGGNYTVTITDANGCTKTGNGNVLNTPCANTQLITSMSSIPNTSTSATSCNGSLTVTVSGGNDPYTYAWATAQSSSTTPTLSNLCAGTYSVVVKDSNGCAKTAIGVIQNQSPVDPCQTSQFTAYFNSMPNTAGTNCNGTINVIVSGGQAPYTFTWPNSTYTTNTPSLQGVCAGNYTMSVSDNIGCTISISGTVAEIVTVNPCANSTLSAVLTSTNVSAGPATNCDGSVTSTVSGGIAPYTYLWNNGVTTANISDVCSGIYGLTVKDL